MWFAHSDPTKMAHRAYTTQFNTLYAATPQHIARRATRGRSARIPSYANRMPYVYTNARCAQSHTARRSWLPVQSSRCRPARTLIGSLQLMQRSMAMCAARACSMRCEHQPITIIIVLNRCRLAQYTRRGDHGHSTHPTRCVPIGPRNQKIHITHNRTLAYINIDGSP